MLKNLFDIVFYINLHVFYINLYVEIFSLASVNPYGRYSY